MVQPSEAMCQVRGMALYVIANLAPYVISDWETRLFIDESRQLFQSLGETGRYGMVLTKFYEALFRVKDFSEKSRLYDELALKFLEFGDTFGAASCFHMKGNDALYANETEIAEDYLDRALKLLKEIGDRDAVPAGLIKAAMLAYRRCDLAKATAYVTEARSILDEVGEVLFSCKQAGHEYLGDLVWKMGDFTQAEHDYSQGLALGEKVKGYRLANLDKLSRLALVQEMTSQAQSLLSACHATAKQHGDLYMVFQAARYQADLAWMEGDESLAVQRFEEFLNAPVDFPQIIAQVGLAKIALRNGNNLAAMDHLAQALEIQVPIVDLSISFEDAFMSVSLAGVLLLRKGEIVQAARLLGAADNSYRFNRLTLPPPHREMVDGAYAEIHTALQDADTARAWSEGEKLGLAQALAYALEAVNLVRQS